MRLATRHRGASVAPGYPVESEFMKMRSLKALALLSASGFLLQVAGCGGIISQLVINEVVTRVLIRLLDVVLGNGGTSATTT